MFRILRCKSFSETVNLRGRLKWGFYRAILPSGLGLNQYIIDVKSGNLRLNLLAQDSANDTWAFYPGNEQKPYYDLQKGQTYEVELTIDECFQKPVKFDIVNISMLIDAEFSYRMNRYL